MAYSKAFLLLGLLCAVVLVLSSEVSARELAEAAQTQGSVEEAKHWGHGHGHGHWDMEMVMVMATGMDTMANPDMVVLLRQRKMKVKQARIRQKHF
ncbi:glycine-rich protein DC7.1-like isoform X1 [Vitis riparia]|uniref:glycine-rich protein DC7.1-like isoform X1 n=1 Tax=Vitis riparia TaxID=96939 RepID=UPI00155B37A8|nr:glycine-rich protein DC7.1-like isoform X1 [Vitis riparia]